MLQFDAHEDTRPPNHDEGGDEDAGTKLSDMLLAIASDTQRTRIAVSDLLEIMSDRAFGALLFIFALPNVLPTPPGTSAVLGAPLLFLAAQLTFGRPAPWLPQFIAKRSLAQKDFAAMVQRVAPWIMRAERLLKPRFGVLVRPPADRVIGAVALILSIVLFLPIPLGNMLPALAICVLALAMLQEDGLVALLGLLTAGVSLVVVSGVLYALVMSTLYVIRQFIGF